MTIRHHALATVAVTLVLMTLGSLVHGTGSSLACPDWPLCHGSFFPAMVNGVQFEHTHRLVAAAVVVATLSLCARTLLPSGAPARRPLVLACVLVAVQAVLGGLTVIYRLPPAISVAHLATSMAFLSVLVVAAVRLTPRAPTGDGKALLQGLACVVVYVQIVLGAAVRHTGAAFACVGLPFCDGEALPAATLARLQMVHRVVGVLALLVVLVSSVRAYRRAPTPNLRGVALLPVLAVVVQLALGAALVLARAPLDLVTLHHLVGALLLGSTVASWAFMTTVSWEGGLR